MQTYCLNKTKAQIINEFEETVIKLKDSGITITTQKRVYVLVMPGFSGGSDGTKSACSVGDPGLIPGSGR